ncbi:predicted protein [Naegleria gruberi]|uniref:Predicted protein n=1 Tax=Naegleria gruberi TaxID=5762 RepID=D2VXZ4_NAEGR|nr:uncharacterized protein NAEGRDRAFT_73913 [Naegleria gruberi]EFC38231.1 predicted protein [Naegleria gruberi]|eukprot:XP_002670975.1 predicted protein [Naegleria gruberi strain NEG-M]
MFVSANGLNFSNSNIVSSGITSEAGQILIISSNIENSGMDIRIGLSAELSYSKFVNTSLNVVGMNSLILDNSIFTTNSSLSIVGISKVRIFRGNFSYNSNALSMEYVTSIELIGCNFIRNLKPLRVVNRPKVTTGSNILKVDSCLFVENTAQYGGAIYSEFTTIISTNNRYISNKAANGGAIYVKSTTFIDSYSTLDSNQAILGLFDCNNPEECGNGGAVYSVDGYGQFVSQSVINGNQAVKGGICFNRCIFSASLLMSNNRASYSGSDIFFKEIPPEFRNAIPLRYKSNGLGSRELIGVKWRIMTDRESLFDSNEYHIISVYPGKTISIEFTSLIDIFNNTLESSQIAPSISLLSSGGYNIVTNPFDVNSNTFLNVYVQAPNDRMEHILNASVAFSDRDFTFEFGIRVERCPFDYAFDSSTNVCTFRSHTAIILAVVFGVLILFIFMGVGLVSCVKITQALVKLYKREKKEKRIAHKLIDKQFIFGDESPLLINLLAKNVNNIIIPIEDIEIVKRIGEGSMGTVYMASWNGITVALKSIKTDSFDISEDEFEHEASLLNSLRHPSIVRFYGVSLSNTNKYMVVEYLENGSLDAIIAQSKCGRRTLDLKSKIEILKGIASGMDYLHSLKPRSLIHR